jgi:hypothetical protein
MNGKDRAIALLCTARSMESPEDMVKLIERATDYLRDEPELIAGMQMVADMIYSALWSMGANMPGPDDTLKERAEKIHICEAALLQIGDYAKQGLKVRQLGSMEFAEAAKQARINPGLHEFADTKVEISVNGDTPVKTTFGQFEKAVESVTGGDN